MQGGPLDVGAADEDRLEHGVGRGPAGTADRDHDVEQRRGALLGRELVGDRPPGRPGGDAELGAGGEVGDLHDGAVDLVGQIVAVLLPALAEGHHVVDVVERADLGVHREAELAEKLEGLLVAGHRRSALDLAELVGPQRQLAPGGDRRILLA